MHQVIQDRLEEYLSGSLESREFTAHLESCPHCRHPVLLHPIHSLHRSGVPVVNDRLHY